MTNFKVYDLKF